MPFALTVSHLIEVLQDEGCPICRFERRAAAQSIDSFLWENVNDPGTRKPIVDAYGFCPDHTRLLVAMELSNSGALIGVNLIYEHLGRLTAKELSALAGKLEHPFASRGLIDNLNLAKRSQRKARVLPPKGRCPICVSSEQAGLNALSDLFETLQNGDSEVREAYLASDGLCLSHLRAGIECLAGSCPAAAKEVLLDAAKRLENQSKQMKEYLRKQNWEYRHEKLTPEEAIAWKKTLIFFTGYPGSLFTHIYEQY